MLDFFEAYLDRLSELHGHLRETIAGLPVQALDWSPGPEVNSLAVLVTHATGAERFWVGDMAGRDPSARSREAEFHVRGMDAVMLEKRLDDLLDYTRGVLAGLRLEDLGSARLSERHGREFSVAWCLLHALEHTAIHVGHAQLVRQLWEKEGPVSGEVTGPTD